MPTAKCVGMVGQPYFAGQRKNTCVAGANARSTVSMRRLTALNPASALSSPAGRAKARGPGSESWRSGAVSFQGSGQAPPGSDSHAAGSDSFASHRHGCPDHVHAARRAERSVRRDERGFETRFGRKSGSRSNPRACSSGDVRRIPDRGSHAPGLPGACLSRRVLRLTAPRNSTRPLGSHRVAARRELAWAWREPESKCGCGTEQGSKRETSPGPGANRWIHCRFLHQILSLRPDDRQPVRAHRFIGTPLCGRALGRSRDSRPYPERKLCGPAPGDAEAAVRHRATASYHAEEFQSPSRRGQLCRIESPKPSFPAIFTPCPGVQAYGAAANTVLMKRDNNLTGHATATRQKV